MRIFIASLLLAMSLGVNASGFWTVTAQAPMSEVYPAVYKALEDNRFWVVYEADMGSFMEKNKDRWGENYNRNQLDAIKSMVFCNIGWTNAMANAHPDLLGVCPLSVSLYEKDGQTRIILPRPTRLAEGSPAGDKALSAASELENTLTEIIGKAVTGVK